MRFSLASSGAVIFSVCLHLGAQPTLESAPDVPIVDLPNSKLIVGQVPGASKKDFQAFSREDAST
jgi:hypothetical protein